MSKFYITTAIPYVNAPPHIGHALELIQADVIARKARLDEREVFFLTGTDEHGLKNWRSARQLNQPVQDFTDANAGLFRDLLQKLDISNDFFVRTSDRKIHWPNAQKLWQELVRSESIYKKPYRGLYCVGHETFHSETELVNGHCPDYPGKVLEMVEEENYFFRLSKYASDLRALIASDEFRVMPESRKNEVLAFIDKGLEDVSFSRSREKLPWGVSVPDDPEQVMYVWCDALSNYLSGVNYAAAGAQFQKFWPPDIQVIGKDILRFHALIWPAMLLAAKLPLPKTLFVHGFLTFDGEKMSKTLGNVVDPFEIVGRYGVDALRYFLLREVPTAADGDFSEVKLKERYNADLANGLGNLLSRILAIGEKYGREFTLGTEDLSQETRAAWSMHGQSFASFKLNESLASIWQLLQRTDEYLNKKEPWKMLRVHNHDFSESHEDELAQTLSSVVLALANASWMLQPFLPQTAQKLLVALKMDSGQSAPWRGRKLMLQRTAQLFPRIDI